MKLKMVAATAAAGCAWATLLAFGWANTYVGAGGDGSWMPDERDRLMVADWEIERLNAVVRHFEDLNAELLREVARLRGETGAVSSRHAAMDAADD